MYRLLSPRQTGALLFWSILAILLGLRLPALSQSVLLDYVSVTMISTCGSKHVSVNHELFEAVAKTHRGRITWLKAVQAQCRGDEIGARSALREALAFSDTRLFAIRSAARHDPDLARFATDKYPDRAEAHFWLGDALLEQGDKEGALQAYERGLELSADAPNVWVIVGNLYQDKDALFRAAQAYDQACAYGDKGKNGCLRAGTIYLEQEQYALAAERFKASVAQFAYFYAPSVKGLATALLAMGRTEEAVPHLTSLAQHGDEEAQKMLDDIQGGDR